LSAGLRLRFGRYNDIFNLSLGADYQNYWGKYVTTIDYGGYYVEEETHYRTIHRRLAFPVNVKINIPFKHSKGAFYFGFTSEFGYEINDVLSYFKQINKFEDVLNWQKPSIAIEPQIGFNHKHFEWGFYYKYYLKGYRFFESEYSEEYLDGFNRFGISMSVYF
jgi:hypothetical protein